jgi:iron complex outermembrane receptor protein
MLVAHLSPSCFGQDRVTTEDTVITATRFLQPRTETPIGVSVVAPEDPVFAGAGFLPEALGRLSGVTVRDNSGSPDAQVDLRGFGITGDQNTLVLVDGQRISQNELTPAPWSSIPMSSLDRVEVLRSSGSVLYGGGTTGGVINVVTRALQPGERTAEAVARYGSYNTSDVQARVALAGERVGVSANLGRYYSDNYREHNRVIDTNGQAALYLLGPGPQATLRITSAQQDLDLPGARTEAQLETDRRGATTPGDYATRQDQRMNLATQFPVGAGEVRVDVGYRHKDADSFLVFFGNPFTTLTQDEVWNVAPRLRMPFTIGAVPNTLVAGVDWDDWRYNSTRSFGPAHIVATQSNRAVYVQDTLEFPTRTLVSAGVRLQEVDYDAHDADSNQPYAGGSQTRRIPAYELALRQAVGDHWWLYGKLGTSFRLGTVDEIYNQFGGPAFDPIVTFLEPQTSRDREIGAEYRTAQFYTRAAAYWMDLTNEIHFNPVTFTNENLPPTQRYGVEVEMTLRLNAHLEIAGNYTHAVARFRSGTFSGIDVSGKTIPLVPSDKVNAQVSLLFTQRTRAILAASWVGEQYFDGDETNSFGRRMPAYSVVDLIFSHDQGNWTLAAGVKNLFNERYFTYGLANVPTPGTFVAYPAAERFLFASAQYQFR